MKGNRGCAVNVIVAAPYPTRTQEFASGNLNAARHPAMLLLRFNELSYSSHQNPPARAPVQHYFCALQDKPEGPFDLIELAAQLRYANINPSTLICRQGEETWSPLQDLPEYLTLHEISIEAIARHVEEKARPQSAPFSPAQIRPVMSGLKPIAMLLAVAAGFVLLLYLFQGASPAVIAPVSSGDAPAPPAWPTTVGDSFSIDCPVLLNRQNPESELESESYRAASPGFTFAVDLYRIPQLQSDALYTQLINGARDKLVASEGRTIVSQHFISNNGRRGLDVFFTDQAEGIKYEGGLRVLAGSGRLAVAAIEARSDRLHTGDIVRFLNSFLVH
jgi:hypothetical protein